jgi:hypothetical protein
MFVRRKGWLSWTEKVAKLVAPAALWVRIQADKISQKASFEDGMMELGVANTHLSLPDPKVNICYFC